MSRSQAAPPSSADALSDRAIRHYQLVGLLALVVLFIGAGGWAARAKIQGAVIAPASVAVQTSLKKIQHVTGGIVAKIAVKNGDRVRPGDLLLRLDATEARANLSIIEARLEELLAKKARLVAERDDAAEIRLPPQVAQALPAARLQAVIKGQTRLLVARRNMRRAMGQQLQEQRAQLREQVKGLQAQLAAKRQQGVLVRQELQALSKLSRKKLVTQSRLLTLKREQARLLGETGEIVARIAQTRGRISEIQVKMLQMRHDWRREVLAELRQVQTQISELMERRMAARAQLARIDILAPRAGIVHDLSVHTVGGVIGPGEAVMFIIPDEDRLVFDARVQPADIDQVRLGQRASIRLPGLDQRTTPEIFGKVAFIAGDLSQPDAAQPPFYAVRVEVDEQELARLGQVKLVPGMPAEVFIQTAPRTVLSYLLRPLQDQLARAFRDG